MEQPVTVAPGRGQWRAPQERSRALHVSNCILRAIRASATVQGAWLETVLLEARERLFRPQCSSLDTLETALRLQNYQGEWSRLQFGCRSEHSRVKPTETFLWPLMRRRRKLEKAPIWHATALSKHLSRTLMPSRHESAHLRRSFGHRRVWNRYSLESLSDLTQ